jgi:hypothetical protein
MSTSRLLAVSLLLTVTAALAIAQSSSPVPSSSEKSGTTSPNFLEPSRIEEYRPHLDHFVLPPELRAQPEAQPQNDAFCYSIRSYKVARDNPNSDSVHPVKYSTCQPSARFTVRTIRLQNLPSPE